MVRAVTPQQPAVRLPRTFLCGVCMVCFLGTMVAEMLLLSHICFRCNDKCKYDNKINTFPVLLESVFDLIIPLS